MIVCLSCIKLLVLRKIMHVLLVLDCWEEGQGACMESVSTCMEEVPTETLTCCQGYLVHLPRTCFLLHLLGHTCSPLLSLTIIRANTSSRSTVEYLKEHKYILAIGNA